MGSGESNAAEIAANLHESVEELLSTRAPMEAIADNSWRLANEIDEQRAALAGVLQFFQALPDRLANDLTANYDVVQPKYTSVAERTLPVVSGTENPRAVHAREAIKTLADANLERVPVSRMEGKGRDFQEITGALSWLIDEGLRAMMRDLKLGRGNALGFLKTADNVVFDLEAYGNEL